MIVKLKRVLKYVRGVYQIIAVSGGLVMVDLDMYSMPKFCKVSVYTYTCEVCIPVISGSPGEESLPCSCQRSFIGQPQMVQGSVLRPRFV